MPSDSDTTRRVLSLRLDGALYTAAQGMAERKHVSLNALLAQALSELLRREQDAELARGFDILGGDAESNVDYAFEAQGQVVLADED